MDLQSILELAAFIVGGSAAIAIGLPLSLSILSGLTKKIESIKEGFRGNIAILVDSVDVVEISNNESHLPYEWKSDSGADNTAKEMILELGGTLSDRKVYFNNDSGSGVQVLIGNNGASSYIFKENFIFQLNDGIKGEVAGSFSSPDIRFVTHVTSVNDKYALIVGDGCLWQVNLENFSKHRLTTVPYYDFERPPKIFKPPGFDGEVVVYYTGELDFNFFAFGGDISRPKYSVVRVYNGQFPSGADVAKFYFYAATIVRVDFKDGSLVLTGDPSKPGGSEKNRKPARVWRLEFSENNKLHA